MDYFNNIKLQIYVNINLTDTCIRGQWVLLQLKKYYKFVIKFVFNM